MKDTTSQSGKEHKPRLIQYANGPSLEEINGTVEVPKGKGFWKTLFAYSGPGALVAVGYMDPGNWSTSITGGQNFQYLLMSVILMDFNGISDYGNRYCGSNWRINCSLFTF